MKTNSVNDDEAHTTIVVRTVGLSILEEDIEEDSMLNAMLHSAGRTSIKWGIYTA